MKKNYLPRGLIFVLLCFTALVLFGSCSAEPDSAALTDNETPDTENGAGQQAEEPDITDDVPDLSFDGETFTILYRDYMEYETNAESENGEVVNDAVFRRNIAIEERFGIKFNMVTTQGAWDHGPAFLQRVRNSVSAGDEAYDMVNGYAAYIVELTHGGYLRNWKEIPYIGFDKPWWNRDFISEMTINNNLFFITGDLALSTIHMANALFFNKEMWADYGFDDPYPIVKEGKWTIDRMAEFTRQVSEDLDLDGRFTEDDLYGYVTDTHNQVDAYVVSFDVPVTVKNSEGIPELVVDSDKFTTAFLKLYAFMREDTSTFAGTEQPTATDIYSIYRPIFQNRRALIFAEYLGNSSQMRDYDVDFGILPFPKLDENQERYKTKPQDGYTMFCIPSTSVASEKLGAVIETLAAESNKSVVPAFYEVALKTKYARDEESSAMIDIIREGISFNFGIANTVLLNRPHLVWRTLISNDRDNIASEVERGMRNWERDLERLLEAYE